MAKNTMNVTKNDIYECHKKCFDKIGDILYKSDLQQSLETSYVIERLDTNKIIGVMLQGNIKPCQPSELENFEVINESGKIFYQNNLHLESIPGITMLCIDPEFRGKDLAKKLIEIHLKNYKDDIVCLNTRKSNPAFNLYLKMGYEHIATIKKLYYQPNEDGYFMIKK